MIKVKKFTGRKSKKATVNTGVVHIKSHLITLLLILPINKEILYFGLRPELVALKGQKREHLLPLNLQLKKLV